MVQGTSLYASGGRREEGTSLFPLGGKREVLLPSWAEEGRGVFPLPSEWEEERVGNCGLFWPPGTGKISGRRVQKASTILPEIDEKSSFLGQFLVIFG